MGALLLVAAGYYVLTQVVTVERIRQEAARLPRPSLVSLLPQATPTAARLPTRPTEVRPTLTRIPTVTPVLSPTPAETPAETPTEAPSATPAIRRATAAPGFRYAAVELLAPASGSEFAGPDAVVQLSWTVAGALAEDEWYAVSLRYPAEGQTHYAGTWLKETTWRPAPELAGKPDPAQPGFEWDVRVVKWTGTNPDGSGAGAPVSPTSATWTFSWR